METEQSVTVASKWDQLPRKEKRKNMKKFKRKAARKEGAEKERARLNDPEEQQRIELQEQAEAEAVEKARKDFEEHERIWILTHQEAQLKRQEEIQIQQAQEAAKKEEEENWEYVEDGPAEIIWQGNEIIVQKKKIRVPKGKLDVNTVADDSNRPISNPLPPQRDAFEAYSKLETPGFKAFDAVEQQIPNFGTEQDKTHCPFHVKTGACRFGARCSRAHFYPDKSCTLLMKNMYNGPGLTWEQEEGLEYTDEEVVHHYEEFYEDVHTEFLKFGELVNFKVICEFVGVMRWRVAICGEYMKSDRKNCSRGSACNFLHCFRNPGGEYDWADWDSRPPRSWVNKMDMLFGGSRVDQYDHQKLRDQDHWNRYGHSVRRIQSRSSYKSSSRRHKSHERDSCSSGEDRGTPTREPSNGRKYGGKEEREQRSDLDQNCAAYNRSSSRSSSRWRKFHERDLCSSDEDRGTPVREHSGGRKYYGKEEREQRKYSGKEEREQRSDMDQTCATYHISSCRSSSRRHKSHERDSCNSDEDRGTPIREQSGGRKYSDEEREQRLNFDQNYATCKRRVNRRSPSHDRGGFEKSENRSSCRSSSRQHKSHERDSCNSVEDRGTPIREQSGGRKYSDEEREQRLNFHQNYATCKRQVNRRSPSHDRGGFEKSKNDYVISEEDIKSRDCHQAKRKKHYRELTCEDDDDDKERSVVSVDMDLVGELQCKRRNESCIQFESDMDKLKSNDRETMRREDVKSSHYKKEQKRKASRRAQDQLELENIDQEKIKLSKSCYHCEQMPCKHEDHKKISKRHQYSKSPIRSRKHNWLQSGEKGQSISPDKDNHNNKLPSTSRNSSVKAPKRSLDEGSFAILDRWQASDEPEL
ncbi:zinc finger CCCH domain-containing protein 5 isoform X2 [Cryptomeria japonica]|uniref:zinc finger CCCH domain-containing protein 5 isoform X2 n=1 Tax=Cryptomeria japonica TaxID=3369 RepID=UPI0025AD62FA|nr:zinc finger CCCH domain-containing protein 5 isoform X2 [Cryptomeria japonica]